MQEEAAVVALILLFNQCETMLCLITKSNSVSRRWTGDMQFVHKIMDLIILSGVPVILYNNNIPVSRVNLIFRNH